METPKTVCSCGCGAAINPGRKWKRGHGPHGSALPPHPCACGCGKLIPAASEYAKHHWHASQAAAKVAVVQGQLVKGERQPCACGCGEPSTLGRRFKRGHGDYARPASPCRCGCGAVVEPPAYYLPGHYQRTDAFKAIFKTDEWKLVHSKGQSAAFENWKLGNSGLNDKVAIELAKQSIPQDFHREYRIHFYHVDFAWPERRIALEVMGCRWHLCPDHPKTWGDLPSDRIAKQLRRDAGKRTFLKNRGWKVIYLWEHDVKEGLWSVDAPFQPDPQQQKQSALFDEEGELPPEFLDVGPPIAAESVTGGPGLDDWASFYFYPAVGRRDQRRGVTVLLSLPCVGVDQATGLVILEARHLFVGP